MSDLPTRRHDALVACGVALALYLALMLSWPALSGPFLFDDFPNLQHLSALEGQLDWKSIAHYVSLFEGQPGRPLAMLSFVLNDTAWPSEPRAFKYTNLMLHLLAGVVLFGMARSLAGARTDRAAADRVALVTAAAWLLHPMQLSTSMLVIQRMTQLSALFAFLGIWGYCAIARRVRRPSDAVGAVAILGLGTVFAVLCKENGALVPLLAAVLNATMLRKHLVRLPASSRRILQFGTWLPVAILGVAIAARWDSLTWYGTRDFTMAERLASQCRALVDYLWQVFMPRLSGAGIFHDDFEVSRGLLEPWTTLPAILAVVAIACTAFAVRRRCPVATFAIGWFFAGHALESSVFPLELYFEHRNYLPMAGPLFGLAWMACHLSPRRRFVVSGAVLLWLGLAATMTSIQARTWGNRAALATVWAIDHPRSQRALQLHADHLLRGGDPRAAAAVLLDAGTEGIGGTAFPLQAMIIGCHARDTVIASEASRRLAHMLPSGGHELGVLAAVTSLRQSTVRRACPGIFDDRDFLGITGALLTNRQYTLGHSAAYLHVERAHLFRARRNLDATMRELERAAAAHPSADLALFAATTLASAGLLDDAEAWARRGLSWTPGGVRGLLSADDEKLLRFLELIRQARESTPGA